MRQQCFQVGGVRYTLVTGGKTRHCAAAVRVERRNVMLLWRRREMMELAARAVPTTTHSLAYTAVVVPLQFPNIRTL